MYDTRISESKVPTFAERLEHFLSWKDHAPKYASRGVQLNPNDNICIVKNSFDVDEQNWNKEWMYTHNVVTNDGDIYYAKQGANETHAANEDFGDVTARMELRTGAASPAKGDTYTNVTTPITASRKVLDTSYPKTNDTGDSDNTGDGVDVVSYRTSWTTGDFNSTGIIGGCIHENASPTASTKLLTHWSITSFDKTSNDTLKIFVNHTMDGQLSAYSPHFFFFLSNP
jgi:hypothetical protein